MTLAQQIEQIGGGWECILSRNAVRTALGHLETFLELESAQHAVYPPRESVFAALEACSLNTVRIVILGQDPYINAGEANGLAFSVPAGLRLPPSLRNIFEELGREYNRPARQEGDLSDWAKQGVLLLNSTLTVRAGASASHARLGWEVVTDALIEAVATKRNEVVFMLWGRYAQSKGQYIDGRRHLVLKSSHPSPLSAGRGFKGCDHFLQAEEYLHKTGQGTIQWFQ